MKLRDDQIKQVCSLVVSFAQLSRNYLGEVPPTLILINARPGGELGDLSTGPLTYGTKDQWAHLQQRFARSPDIAAAVLILECWGCDLKPGEQQPETVSERQDRYEMVMVNIMSATDQWLMLAPITAAGLIEEAPAQRVGSDGPRTFKGRFIREPGAPVGTTLQ